jgi:ribose transport system permease protein
MVPLIIAWIILLIYFRMKVPGFLARDNMIGLVEQISVNAIIACGMTYCILIGGIDLSVGAVLALVGTVTVSVLNLGHPTDQSVLQLALAICAGLGVAA